MNWFYSKDGQPAGPVGDAEFERLVASGTIRGTTLVWHSDLQDWKPYAEVRPAGAPPPLRESAPPRAPILTRGSSELEDSPRAAGHPGAGFHYAGFWIRVVASLFDSLILLPLFSVIYLGFFVEFPEFLSDHPEGGHVRLLFQLVVVVLGATYETLFVGRFAATPGKMICNLRTIHSDGAKISYGRSLARYFCKGFSGAFFLLGYLVVAFTPQKCGLHDYICDTRVIHTS